MQGINKMRKLRGNANVWAHVIIQILECLFLILSSFSISSLHFSGTGNSTGDPQNPQNLRHNVLTQYSNVTDRDYAKVLGLLWKDTPRVLTHLDKRCKICATVSAFVYIIRLYLG